MVRAGEMVKGVIGQDGCHSRHQGGLGIRTIHKLPFPLLLLTSFLFSSLPSITCRKRIQKDNEYL